MAKMVDFGGFLDLTRLLGGVTRSNLVQIARNTSPHVVEGLAWVGGPYFTVKITPGMSRNSGFDPKMAPNGPKWRFFGPHATCRAR